MPSDYEQITLDNIRRRGEEFDDIGRLLSEQLYSDRTHFIYELLQNAEDALERRFQSSPDSCLPSDVRFCLYQDRLEFRHYGQPFNTDDVRGISDVLKGTKAADINQIGKFGIGFKSVYAFTASPRIHSGDEHFEIERFIRPRKDDQVVLMNEGETIFIFPFNHDQVNPEVSFRLISEKLRRIGPRVLLFLNRINRIEWRIKENGEYGTYSKAVRRRGAGRLVTVTGQNSSTNTKEDWLVFERKVSLPESVLATRVEIAFRLIIDEKSKQISIRKVEESSLAVFFPTEKETRLGFIIQGPYRTTPSRDNVPKEDQWNIKLVKETSSLILDTLPQLRDAGLMSVSLLEALPTRQRDFPIDSMFHPFYEVVRFALLRQPLLPTVNGDFLAAKQVKLARTVELRNLFKMAQLQDLFLSNVQINWLVGEITQDKTPDLRFYLTQELGVEEIRPESIAQKLTGSFLAKQTDAWIVEFYSFLDGQSDLWEKPDSILRKKEFLRLEDDSHVKPFQEDGRPNAYLPGSTETKFPTIKRDIASHPNAARFLQRLGIIEPDLFSEVIEFIVPKYSAAGPEVDYEENIQDLRKIALALETPPQGNPTDLRAKMRLLLAQLGLEEALDKFSGTGTKLLVIVFKIALGSVPLFRASNQLSNDLSYKAASKLYFPIARLKEYFEGNGNAWFLYNEYPPDIIGLGLSLGCSNAPGIQCGQKDERGYVVVRKQHGSHERGLDGFDPNCMIDGLDHALVHPTAAKSAYIWNELAIPNAQHVRGMVESSSRSDYARSKIKDCVSKIGSLLINSEWLPDSQGLMHRPKELSLDDLPEAFKHDEQLAKQLGMRSDIEQSYLSKLPEEERERIKLSKLIPLDELRKLAQIMSNRQEPKEPSLPIVKLNYVEEFNRAFSKSGYSSAEEDPAVPGTLTNPDRYRERAQEEIQEAKEEEPSSEARFRRIARKVWEGRGEDTRRFLEEQYAGKCQICSSVFARRSDGRPYFEGLYIVHRTRARWIDHRGNALCLCPTCSAKFQYGTVEADDVMSQILQLRVRNEGGMGDLHVYINLCGDKCMIGFSERHLLALQELLRSDE